MVNIGLISIFILWVYVLIKLMLDKKKLTANRYRAVAILGAITILLLVIICLAIYNR